MADSILIVDDDTLMRRSLAFGLQRAGCHVNTAANVGDALATIDPTAHTVTIGGKAVSLPPREFEILHTLALEVGRVVSAEDL